MAWIAPFHPRSQFSIAGKPATRAQFKRATSRHRGAPLKRHRGARGRKRAILEAVPLRGCWHEFSYREDWEGDPGVIGGTRSLCWLECDCCGEQRSASHEDRPSYDDYDGWGD
jgi:hypothetical protein